MLKYTLNDFSEGIDINKIIASKKCDICHYWYFFKKTIYYEPYLCNGCHKLIQKPMDLNDVAIFSVKGSDCRVHF